MVGHFAKIGSHLFVSPDQSTCPEGGEEWNQSSLELGTQIESDMGASGALFIYNRCMQHVCGQTGMTAAPTSVVRASVALTAKRVSTTLVIR